jgi:hypothetical protein
MPQKPKLAPINPAKIKNREVAQSPLLRENLGSTLPNPTEGLSMAE